MAFRDDTEALRAQVETLEEDLAQARRALENHEALESEVVRLRTCVAELEVELAKALDTPEARARREAARVAAERAAAEAEAARLAEEHGVGSRRSRTGAIGVLAGVMAVGAIGVFLAVNRSGSETWRAGDAPPSLGTVDLSSLGPPVTFEGTTEGQSSTPGSCPGHVPLAPHLALESPGGATVVIEALSSRDTVLLVLASDGSLRCDDDSAGDFNPRVTANLPAGRTLVWVGTYESGEDASFRLTVGGLAVPPSSPATR